MKQIKFLIWLLILINTTYIQAHFKEDIEDNEFAEFEEFEEDDETVLKQSSVEIPQDIETEQLDEKLIEVEDEDTIVEDDDSEFDHFQDEEEFEGFSSDRTSGQTKMNDKEVPKITIAKVPLHLRTNWDSYYLEMMMVLGLIVYFLNFFTGKNRNNKLANVWYFTHKSLLDENFSLVGDDGKLEIENAGLLKESENLYTLWCSGRTCCEGMLVELKLLKRQDLLSVMAQMVRPTTDQIRIRVDMNKEDMDTFVFCIANKKSAVKLSRDMADLNVYCPERRTGDKLGVPNNFSIMSEINEVTLAILDSKFLSVLTKYGDLIDCIHFSDQYSGLKQTEDVNVTKLPDVKKVLIFSFSIPLKGKSIQDAVDQTRPLLQLVFYSMEKVKRYRLSKEAKAKADKNRLRVEEAFLKTTHAARAEAAAARREEKKRQEKERILQEDDPEKQRKWEEKEMKRQMKRKGPKMKQLKVKAL